MPEHWTFLQNQPLIVWVVLGVFRSVLMSLPVRSLCRGALIAGATLFATSAFAQMELKIIDRFKASED